MATAILSEYRKVIPNATEPLVKSGILTESNHGNISANNPQLEHFPPDLRQQPRSDHHRQHRSLRLVHNLLDGSVMPTSTSELRYKVMMDGDNFLGCRESASHRASSS